LLKTKVHQAGISRQVNPFQVFCPIIAAVSVDVVDRLIVSFTKGLSYKAVNVKASLIAFVTELGGFVAVGIKPSAFGGLLANDADFPGVTDFVIGPVGHGAPFSHRKPAWLP
jgi:hypothetical protein